MYTITGKTDGFGAQYQSIMSGIAICAFKKLTYVHTPFKQLEHTTEIDKLNKFIGLKPGMTNNVVYSEPYSKEVHESCNPSIYYTNTVIKSIRDAYYSTEKPSISSVDIAIHIRRGDIVNNRNCINRYTSNSVYLHIINALKKIYPTYNISIFSEGTCDDFAELKQERVEFKLNEDITETFHSLVCAKVLVMAKSSFSYAAAILNENTIYYENFWHKPLNNWKNINSLIMGVHNTVP